MIVATEFGTGQVFWSLVWLTFWIIWLWLLFIVFRSIIFRSHDPGWTKALWVLFVILLPYIGVFVYLIVRNVQDYDPGPPTPWIGSPPMQLAT